MNKSRSGFTIVELLIVIVVIGILATITITVYTGVQTRANNTASVSAAATWMKAFKSYEADNGELPHTGYDSCLGTGYPWDYDSQASGLNQCRYTTTSYYIEKVGISNALKPYMNNQLPTPSMQTVGTSTTWARGLIYAAPAVGGQFNLIVVIAGSDGCPVISGINATLSARTGGALCYYPLGVRLR